MIHPPIGLWIQLPELLRRVMMFLLMNSHSYSFGKVSPSSSQSRRDYSHINPYSPLGEDLDDDDIHVSDDDYSTVILEHCRMELRW